MAGMLAGSAAGGGAPPVSGAGAGSTGSLLGAGSVCAGPPGVLEVGRGGSMKGRSASGVAGAAGGVTGAGVLSGCPAVGRVPVAGAVACAAGVRTGALRAG